MEWSLVRSSTLVVMAAIAFGSSACSTPEPPEAETLRIVGGGDLGTELIRLYGENIPGAAFSTTGPYDGSFAALSMVERGEAEVTFAGARATYEAFTSGAESLPRPHGELRGMSVLESGALHVLVGPDVEIERLAALAEVQPEEVRVLVGPEWSNSASSARQLLPLFGIPEEALVARPTADIAEELRTGGAQAAFLMRPYPSPAIASILSLPGVRLWELSEAERNTMREADLFLKPATIPAGTYGNHPSVDVLAADRVMVVGADVPEDIVFDMLTVLFDALPDLSSTVPSLSGVRLDRAAAAPIPLHAGATRYYRERQLFP